MLNILQFAKAVRNHLADGCASVSKEQLAARLSACESCEFRRSLVCAHDACGCLLWLKARWKSEKCPDHPPRWPELQAAE